MKKNFNFDCDFDFEEEMNKIIGLCAAVQQFNIANEEDQDVYFAGQVLKERLINLKNILLSAKVTNIKEASA